MSTLTVLAPQRSILSAMKAEREDGYGYHLRDFIAFAEKRGEVTYKTVADYFRALDF